MDVWVNGAVSLATAIIFVTVLALTEEIGWRGYLLPRVQTMVSKRRAALVVGFIHGMLHVPLVVFTTTYNNIGSRLDRGAGRRHGYLRRRLLCLAQGSLGQRLAGRARAHGHRERIRHAGYDCGVAAFLLVRGRTWSASV